MTQNRSHRGYNPGWDESTLLGIGAAHAVSGPDEESQVAGRLYVPDPEQRKGWRERYVYREAKPSERRPLGFGKP